MVNNLRAQNLDLALRKFHGRKIDPVNIGVYLDTSIESHPYIYSQNGIDELVGVLKYNLKMVMARISRQITLATSFRCIVHSITSRDGLWGKIAANNLSLNGNGKVVGTSQSDVSENFLKRTFELMKLYIVGRILGLIFIQIGCYQLLVAQVRFPLYNTVVEQSKKIEQPFIAVYKPTQSNTGTAVIIFPGGAYSFLATNDEGDNVAAAFASKGITAFVVHYRLPDRTNMSNTSMMPLMDAQQAIKFVRMKAKEFGINENHVGVIGYSAGGHVASTLGTHYKISYVANEEKINLRPSFMILVYPVITMDSLLTHKGSRFKLLGDHPSEAEVDFFSNEKKVTADSPPTYLTHTGDDNVVTVENSIIMYEALQKNNVPAELHLYAKGNHGFTISQPTEQWLTPMLSFLKTQGFLE